jgi:hypothetical protein
VEGDDHGEAYTAIARGGLLSRESYNTQRPRPLTEAEGNMSGTVMQGAVALPRSQTPSRPKGLRRNLGDLASGRAALAAPVRAGKAMSFSRR